MSLLQLNEGASELAETDKLLTADMEDVRGKDTVLSKAKTERE